MFSKIIVKNQSHSIAYVAQGFSAGLGYTENVLPKYLARRFGRVYVIVHDLNVGATQASYKTAYRTFLGADRNATGVIRRGKVVYITLPAKKIGSYSFAFGIFSVLKRLNVDIIQFNQIASIDLFLFCLLRKLFEVCTLNRDFKSRLFTETHQHASVAKKLEVMNPMERLWFEISRRLPARLANKMTERVISISVDCTDVALVLYGLPKNKIVEIPLGTDTDHFKFEQTTPDKGKCTMNPKGLLRIVYSGRLTSAKGVDLLLSAFRKIHDENIELLLIGNGELSCEAKKTPNAKHLGFRPYTELASFYREATVCVWPSEESMSMLDAAACGSPVVVSDMMGDKNRIGHNIITYQSHNVDSLVERLNYFLANPVTKEERQNQSNWANLKFSWKTVVEKRYQLYFGGS